MKSIREIAGNAKFAILGGRTLAENAAFWEAKRQGGIQPTVTEPDPIPEAEKQQAEAQRQRWHLTLCGVPDTAAAILAAPKATPAVLAVADWWRSGKGLLLLHGESGVGKTVAACSAFLECKRWLAYESGAESQWDSATCAFERADELARLGYFSPEAKDTLRRLGALRLLVLDDLGAELHSESWRAILDGLLSDRLGRSGTRTILTSNVSAHRKDTKSVSPFEARYGTRIASRIREHGTVEAG